MFSQSKSPLFFPLLPALAGLALSVWNLADAGSVPCPTAGCSIQSAFTIGGVSLWWPGALLFALLAVCALAGQRRAGRALAGLALLGDLPLLLLMLFSLPCFVCMLAALCIALTFVAFKETEISAFGRRPSTLGPALLLVWSFLFVATTGLLLRGTVSPWAIAAPNGQPGVSVYFSFDCAACRKLIFSMAPDTARNNVAWYPVAENADNATAALAMEKALQNGLTVADALREARAATPSSAWQKLAPAWWSMQIRLWINRSHVLLSGHDTLPMVQFHGVPSALLERPRPQPSPAGAPQEDLPFLNIDSAGACTGDTPAGQDCFSSDNEPIKTPQTPDMQQHAE